MKFGTTFMDYLQEHHQEQFVAKSSHVEYKRLKKVLKGCQRCRALRDAYECGRQDGDDEDANGGAIEVYQCDSCQLCDKLFFDELTKEALGVAGCFNTRVRRVLIMHASWVQRCLWRMRHCFMNDQQLMIREGRMLLDYVTVNAIAIRKILKKYDKIHGSVTGRNFKTIMRAKQIELLQSPWLIELGASYINFSGSDIEEPGDFFKTFSCDLSDDQPVMTMTLSNSIKYEYNLTCAICLDMLFMPHALGCGHLFCRACACSAASLLLFDVLKEAPQESKCPVCRTAGVYADSVEMTELDLLLKKRCRKYYKQRQSMERSEMVKQSKEYWRSQAILAIGH